MAVIHKLLKRQLHKYLGEKENIPDCFAKFIDAVNDAYFQADEDREMLERSLELSSRELLQANLEMRAIFKAFPDLFFVLDYSGKIIDYIAASEEDLLLPASGFLGKRVQELRIGNIGRKFQKAIEKTLESQSVQSLEYSLEMGGKEKFYEARIVKLPKNQLITIIRNITEKKLIEKEREQYNEQLEKLVNERTAELVQEISERKIIEEQLRYQKSLIESVYDIALDGILVVTPSGKVLSYNRRFLEIWHLKEDAPELNSNGDIFYLISEKLDEPERFRTQIEYLSAHPDEKHRAINKLKDGRILDRYSSPVTSSDGVYYGRVWFFRDITEQKEIEEQLRNYQESLEDLVRERTQKLQRTNEQFQREISIRKKIEEELIHRNLLLKDKTAEIESANEEIKRFAYLVSHDLRAPLVNLKGFAGELQFAVNTIQGLSGKFLAGLDPDEQEELKTSIESDIPEALSFINNSVSRMDSMINAILKLSRLGRRELYFEKIDMNQLVSLLLDSLKHRIETQGITVKVDKLTSIIADRTSVEQIFGNILGNAVKYLEPDKPGMIEVSCENDEEQVTFHVKDNGRGIAGHEMEKVFELFGRAGKRDVPGEGMGMAYARTLVKRHGGKIWCESEPGKGSTFSFTISKKIADGGPNV
ncbi:MAG: ATP-binding protein [Firmicutes bacterium]|nr:ATP-binding protein [Bacillota bacterium]